LYAARTEEYNPWKTIYKARRHHWGDDYARKGSPHQFLRAGTSHDWLVFLVSLPLLGMLQIYMSKRTRTIRHHLYAVLIWLAVGAAALCYVRLSIGSTAAVHWTTGYVLEFIFTIENVFVFHMVVKGFRADKWSTKTALFYVLFFQIFFCAVFYMGLAHMLRTMDFLPYVLGVWLLYIGISAAIEDGHAELNAEETSVYKFVEWFLGDTLSPHFAESGAIFFTKNGKTCISMVGPLIVCLFIVDFLLEIDVTLTKIEELENEYIAFTSSAIAAFAMPEIYFVAQDLFQRYSLLKYGISFVIIFFGVQMLGHRFFSIPDLLGCAIMVGAMLVCVLLSACLGYGSEPDYSEKASEEDSRVPRSQSRTVQ